MPSYSISTFSRFCGYSSVDLTHSLSPTYRSQQEVQENISELTKYPPPAFVQVFLPCHSCSTWTSSDTVLTLDKLILRSQIKTQNRMQSMLCGSCVRVIDDSSRKTCLLTKSTTPLKLRSWNMSVKKWTLYHRLHAPWNRVNLCQKCLLAVYKSTSLP